MPKNVKGVTFRQKMRKFEQSHKNEKFRKKMRNLNSLTVPEKGGKSHSVKKVERGTLLLWNGFLSHVRGFGCVENEVLSTYGKSALMNKK